MITWYTQPENHSAFSSFYCLKETGELVRIRLELNRPKGEPNNFPFACYLDNRAVGFTKHFLSDASKFKIDEAGQIDYVDNDQTIYLGLDPEVGFYVYDFERGEDDTPLNGIVHWGNRIVAKPNLPKDINESDMKKLATKCMMERSFIQITASDSTEDQLANAIKALLK